MESLDDAALKDAAASSAKVALDVDWQPFYLNRNTPAEGEDLMEHLKAKYGPAAVARFDAADNPLDRAAGKVESQLVDFQAPIAVIPNLAIHLNREANQGWAINAQTELPPILAQLATGASLDCGFLPKSRVRQACPAS